ncbi:hypothetical protein IRZ71_08225 [Flavobacterium sp. ANB]|uniref:hypothetical protein n=1 Tax=unclassified Flavobacterium TaxID=196869 RepID=UPI0012B9DA4C|nr:MULTISPECIES: hypothetical protein [unclassified Flavobacterium]MBF4516325.1 hypothetical protein [Flavobacterium sp. ANB]MTD69778.1 hypothetical protein [Flavobacterium sp. LC2016-13]
MTDIEIKVKILEIFTKQRQRPNRDFEESHFMDFLTYPAYQKDTIKNSFTGVRKYYRFMYKLELEFAICFRPSELDTYYSVDSLTKKVIERIAQRHGNLIIVKQRLEEKETYYIEIVLLILLLALYFFWGINVVSIPFALVFGFGIYWIFGSKIKYRLHNNKLRARILGR